MADGINYVGATKFESKNFVLTKNINNVIYELLVKTHSDMVYVNEKETLTEKLFEIFDLITTNKDDVSDIRAKYDLIAKDAPETFQSFKDVWDYVNINGDPESELIKLIKSKQDAEEGKGLSTNDFTDLLYEKLVNGYSKEELNEKFDIILLTNKNLSTEIEDVKDQTESLEARVDKLEKTAAKIPMSDSDQEPEGIADYSTWFQIIRIDNK